MVESDARIVDQPAARVSLDLAGGSLEVIVNAWTAGGNMSAVRTDLIKAAHEALDAEAEKAKAPAG